MALQAVALATPGMNSTSPGERPSLFLCDAEDPSARESDLFAGLAEDERRHVLGSGLVRGIQAGEAVFRQGDAHQGIYIILTGAVRVYYTAASGREITLAYWSPGNFIGGPELFGEGAHLWSGMSVRPTQVLSLRGHQIRRLMQEIPRFAINLVEALVHKGKCYSALIHMLGTRSVIERLAQLLLTIGRFEGKPTRGGLLLGRPLTHEELAKMVGATRQWVSTALERFRAQGLVDLHRHRIVLCDVRALRELAGCSAARGAIR